MQAAADNLAFAPPPEPAAFRGFVLAVLAHLMLMAALTWGINWQKDTQIAAVEAELWAAVPQQAAPAPVVAPPVVTAPPVVRAPPIAEKVAPPPRVVQDPDIAIEREKKRREEVKRHQQERKELEAREKKLQQEEADRREREDQAKLAKEKEKEKARREQDTKKLASERQKNIDKMLASAAGTGSPSATGNAPRSKGPSATYASRIAARIKPNIVFGESISGNPVAEIVIRVAPDGTIVSAKPLKSSGVKSWDDAVLRAIEKTEKIPRDTDGTVVPEFTISFRPKD